MSVRSVTWLILERKELLDLLYAVILVTSDNDELMSSPGFTWAQLSRAKAFSVRIFCQGGFVVFVTQDSECVLYHVILIFSVTSVTRQQL